MSSITSAQSTNSLRVAQTFTAESGAKNVAFNAQRFDRGQQSYGAATTPPVTKYYGRKIVCVAGAYTIDLTSLTDDEGQTFSAAGLKLQLIRIHNPSSNPVTVTAAVANGYLLWGAAGSVIVPAGADVLLRCNDSLPDVAAGAKDILFTGTGTDYYHVDLLLG